MGSSGTGAVEPVRGYSAHRWGEPAICILPGIGRYAGEDMQSLCLYVWAGGIDHFGERMKNLKHDRFAKINSGAARERRNPEFAVGRVRSTIYGRGNPT